MDYFCDGKFINRCNMKFSVSSATLLKVLQKTSGAVGSNPVLPILEDFLFTLEGDRLTVASTDLETSITATIDVTGEENGVVAIPAKILLDTLKALPEQPITLFVDEENFGIELTSSYGKYKMAGDNPDDFPKIASASEEDSITLDASVITHAIANTLFATSNDEMRLAMTGVLVQVDFNKVTFVATDAHKLVKYSLHNITSDVSQSFILPKKACTLLKNILPSGGDVVVSFNRSHAFFDTDHTKLVCRLIDAKYPDYNGVIPANNPFNLSVHRGDFLNSLRRIVIYSNKTTNQVILKINEGSLNISAQDLDFSNEATEQMSCTYEGDPIIIGFNAKFLIEMLGVLHGDDVRMELSSPNRAGLLLPGVQDDNEEITMLVMPVMLNQ